MISIYTFVRHFNCEKEKQRFKFSFVGTLLFSFAAQGFAYFNFAPQHDAINHAFNFAGGWEVSLGRFLLPLYGIARGKTTMPWFIGMLSILFLSCVVYLIVSILELERPIHIIFSAGFLSANLSITELCGAYMFNLDAYMLSLLFSCLGVYLIVREYRISSVFLSAICFLLSLGLYQAYITVAILLFVFIVCKDAVKKDNLLCRDSIKYVYYCTSLLLGGILYFIFIRLRYYVGR